VRYLPIPSLSTTLCTRIGIQNSADVAFSAALSSIMIPRSIGVDDFIWLGYYRSQLKPTRRTWLVNGHQRLIRNIRPLVVQHEKSTLRREACAVVSRYRVIGEGGQLWLEVVQIHRNSSRIQMALGAWVSSNEIADIDQLVISFSVCRLLEAVPTLCFGIRLHQQYHQQLPTPLQ
jgi:hypothetical protein